MKVIDTRTGGEVKVGDTVRYGEDEAFTLLDVDESLFSATATINRTFRHFQTGELVVNLNEQIPLEVRFFHPAFFLQKVAFIPS
jgi:hypothetical protein